MPILKKLLVACFLLTITGNCLHTYAQDTPPTTRPNWMDRVFYGGNLSLTFGTITYIDLSPQVGYRFTDRFASGVGATYIYFRQGGNQLFNYSTSIYGGSLFSRYLLSETVFAHAEYQPLNFEFYNAAEDALQREWVGSMLVGGGIQQPIGGNAFALFQVLYNLNDSYRSPYPSPLIIRAGFLF